MTYYFLAYVAVFHSCIIFSSLANTSSPFSLPHWALTPTGKILLVLLPLYLNLHGLLMFAAGFFYGPWYMPFTGLIVGVIGSFFLPRNLPIAVISFITGIALTIAFFFD